MGFCKTHGHVFITENCPSCIKCDWCTNQAVETIKGKRLCFAHACAAKYTVN